MNEMPARDDQVAPTLRSEEVAGVLEALASGAPSPRPRSRPVPEIAVVEAARVAFAPPVKAPEPAESFFSMVATALFDAALAAAKNRTFWS